MTAIETERLLLRPLQLEDAAEVIRIRSLSEVSRYQGWVPESKEDIARFIADMDREGFMAPGQWYQLSILTRGDSRLIGDCGLCSAGGDGPQVEMGISLDPSFQKCGYALEAARSLIDFLFLNTDTHRVHVSIDPRNEASLRLFERLGFRKEGLLVQSLWFKGEWVDEVIMATLKGEWQVLGE